MTDPFPLGRLCAVHTIASLRYSVSRSSIWSEGRWKWPLGAKRSYHSSEKNGSSSRQPLHIFSPPPESTATCIPWHQAGRLGWILQKTSQENSARGESPGEQRTRADQSGSWHEGVREERQEEKSQHKETEETREKRWRELHKKHISERCPPSIYLSNLKRKAINQADGWGFLSAQMTPEQLHPSSLPSAQFRLVGCKLKNKLLFGF